MSVLIKVQSDHFANYRQFAVINKRVTMNKYLKVPIGDYIDFLKDHCRLYLQRLSSLSNRERHVFDETMKGASSHAVGYVLGISFRTVEVHRGAIRKKFDCGDFFTVSLLKHRYELALRDALILESYKHIIKLGSTYPDGTLDYLCDALDFTQQIMTRYEISIEE